jgi:hypothetical protein
MCYENAILKEGSTQNFQYYDVLANPQLKSIMLNTLFSPVAVK